MKTISTAGRAACMALAFACAALGSAPVWAETTDFAKVQDLIKNGDFDSAEKRVDATLKTEPDNVNALMYKGNIIFFRNSNVGGIQVYGNEDESIFSTDIGSIDQGSSLVSRDTARKVAVYFLRALKIAPQRMDIQLGLCWTFANAGMKDALIARFPYLRKYGKQQQGLQYNMGDYARVIADNYSLDDGIAVYRAIARLYPDDGNIVNDMGAEYYKHRDLDGAMRYFNKAAHMKNVDADTWQNLALFYTVTGDYARGLAAQKTLSRLRHDSYWKLYDALLRRLRGEAHWKEAVQSFIRQHRHRKQDKAYVMFATDALWVKGNPPVQQDKTEGEDVPTQFTMLLVSTLAREMPDDFSSALNLADMMNNYSNYRRALQLLDGIEQRKLARTQEQVDEVHFEQAWALYASGRKEAANAKWKLLLDSSDFYRKSAAAYFLADDAFDHRQYRQAADYCAKMKDEASQSKYANYCANLYDRAMKKL